MPLLTILYFYEYEELRQIFSLNEQIKNWCLRIWNKKLRIKEYFFMIPIFPMHICIVLHML